MIYCTDLSRTYPEGNYVIYKIVHNGREVYEQRIGRWLPYKTHIEAVADIIRLYGTNPKLHYNGWINEWVINLGYSNYIRFEIVDLNKR